MAWLETHPTSRRFQLCFRWGKRKVRKTLKTKKEAQAEAARLRLEENISLLERGRLVLPEGADIATFLLSDGKLTENPRLVLAPAPLTLKELVENYLKTHSNGAMEMNSLATVRMHLNHFQRSLGEGFAVKDLSALELQGHIDGRVRRRGRKKTPVSPVTLRKEMSSLRACWNWAVQTGVLTGVFPSRGLRYPKLDEKPPFQTWTEIEARIARGGLSKDEEKGLWNCLFLLPPEVTELLEHVKAQASHGWIYPMVMTAAHTGARRSELLRIEVSDVDFAGKTILIREKKRSRSKRTTRRVPMSACLEGVLKEWLDKHPGGQHLFCQRKQMARSKKTRSSPTPVTRDEAHDHLQRTLKDSKWSVLRGYHLLRHSFASCLAAAGTDQRVIDEFMGHQTEEQRRRYRHLFPDQQRSAICAVFG